MKCIDYINGKTKVFGIIGNPIEHTFSPCLQNTIADVLGHNITYVPFCVEKENVRKAVEGAFSLGISGLNVTVPHKVSVMDYLAFIDETAEIIGAVNTLKRTEFGFKGFNTDIIGLKKCFTSRGFEIKNKNVVILGAGGAANSACILAAKEGAKNIFIVNRTIENAENLKKIINKYYNVPVFCMGYDKLLEIENPEIVIQTTSVGMGENAKESPVKNPELFKKVSACVDIIYSPWETMFLNDARKYNVEAANGFDMLVFQGIASYEIWNDINIRDDISQDVKKVLIDYYISKK